MKAFEIAGVPRDEISRFVKGLHSDPFGVLGPHKIGDGVEVRVFRPDARAIEVVLDREPDNPIAAERIDKEGFFCVTVPGAGSDIPYHLRILKPDGSEEFTRDAYQYGPIMGDIDLHLFSEGQHWKIYEKLGAHLQAIGDATGVYFAVWAPNAQRVSVVGDFNHWDGRVNPMRKLLGAGVWELFLPGIKQGTHYKFEIRTQTGAVLLKSDPFALFNQHGKSTASLVYDLERYTWNDADWIEARRQKNWPQSPISIYEVHLGSWRRKEGNCQLTYLELADTLLQYVVEMGYTHIELLPVAEHPFEGSWGYQVTNYYAPTSRFGTPDEFRYFIDKCHQAGIGVIMDWVPAHFPKDAHALAEFDGTDLYEHMDPIYRRYHHGNITFSLLYAFQENFVLVLSHDEVVYGKRSLLAKMPGDEWQKFANLRMFLAWMYGHPGKKLLFMGGEFGQSNEWNHDTSLDWQLVSLPRHDGLRRLVQHLNYIYKSEPALWQLDDSYEGFDWIDLHDADNSVVSFLRRSHEGDTVAFVVNATPVVRYDYRLGVPESGFYHELINTDAETYGGSNVGNFGGVQTQDDPWMGREHSILIHLPPLATLAFRLAR